MKQRRALAILAAVLVVVLFAGACSDGDDDESSSSTTAAPETSTTADGTDGEGLPSEVTDELEAALADKMAEYEVPGAVVGVWVPDEGEWVVAEGVADVEADEPMSTDMYWPIRSITKTFTVASILQLADEGELSLDDTIDQYIDGVPNGDQITLRQLAYMDSGLADYTATEGFGVTLTEDLSHQFTLEELNSFAFDVPPDFEPGAEHVYSNTNTNVLGSVVEDVTGQPIGDVIAERFIEPLDLASTSYPSDDSQYPDPHPTGYSPGESGALEPDPDLFSGLGAAGAMISQLADLRVWVEAYASGELVEADAFGDQLEATPLDEGPEYDAYGTGIGTVEGWWGHTGEGLGVTLLAMHDAESGATVVIAMNASALDDHVPTKLFREIAGILRDAGLAEPEAYAAGGATGSTTTTGETSTTESSTTETVG